MPKRAGGDIRVSRQGQDPVTRIAEWDGMLGEIEDDLITVAWNRQIYRGISEIVAANHDIPESGFFEFFGEAYAASQSVAIRRQLDADRRAESFGRLLRQIARQPSVLTRDHYLGHYHDDHARLWGEQIWDTRWGGTVGTHVDSDIVEGDLESLRSAAEPIKHYVDQHIAHRDRRRSEPPTFADLDHAIDAFEPLVGAYGDLIRGAGLGRLEPTPQYDWLAPFRIAWIRDG